MSEFMDSARVRFWNQHPLLVILIVGLLIRFIIMPLAFTYDSNFWALTVRNIDVGAGLYDMSGYYYTPVWGYVLGLMNVIGNMFLDVGFYAIVVPDAMVFEGSVHQLTATVTSPAFNYFTKIPLVFVDLVTAYVTYLLVLEHTNDNKKAIIGFGLTFLCPTILGSSGIIGMPDSISAMFMMLTLYLVLKERTFLAGMCFGMSILTKFFPIFATLVLVVYLFKKYSSKKEAFKHLLLAIAGVAITAVIIFYPQISEGNLSQCFQFLTDRVGSVGGPSSVLYTFVNNSRVICYILIAIGILLVTREFIITKDENLDKDLMKFSFISITLSLMYPPTTQYIVTLVPLLAYYIAATDYKYMLCWKILAIGSALTMFVSMSSMFMPVAAWWGTISVSSLLDICDFFNMGNYPITIHNVYYVVAGTIQYLGIAIIPLMMYLPYLRSRFGKKPNNNP